jgi:ribosomal protection tetracycline resistance protein
VATGFVAYTMPKPCWAVMEFYIEPGERGSGVVFESQCHVRDILGRYQNQVRQALPLALNQGRLGWPVTDVKITLMGGSTLLEPILEIQFLLPPECVGRVMSDVIAMRGETLDTLPDEERTRLRALVPAATSLDYSTTLAAATGGRCVMSVRLHSCRECPLELGATSPRRNVDPLDESRYILAARSALEGGIFDLD